MEFNNGNVINAVYNKKVLWDAMDMRSERGSHGDVST